MRFRLLLVLLIGCLAAILLAAIVLSPTSILEGLNSAMERLTSADDAPARVEGTVPQRSPVATQGSPDDTAYTPAIGGSRSTATSVSLGWTVPTRKVTEVVGFEAELRTPGDATPSVKRVDAGTTQVTWTDLQPGLAYSLRVASVQRDGTATWSDATQVRTRLPRLFPHALSPDSSFFVDQEGNPWFGRGDTAWSLFVQPAEDQARRYLQDRAAKGFNFVLVNVLERYYASDPPKNAAGEAPFEGLAFRSSPNDAYFDSVERLVAEARRLGITLLLCPAYLGYGGAKDGWSEEAQAASDADMAHYGKYLADRFGEYPNIMWLIGHDRVPTETDRERQESLASALPPGQLVGLGGWQGEGAVGSVQWQPTSIVPDFETIYTYSDDPSATRDALSLSPRRPLLFLEGMYEQEGSVALGDPQLRRQQYGPFLSGAAGVIFGNNPIWHFEGRGLTPWIGSWQDNLDSPGSTDAATFGDLVHSVPWWQMASQQGVVSDPGSGPDQVSARFSAEWGMVYAPSRDRLVLDLSSMTPSRLEIVRADPTSGESVLVSETPPSARLRVSLPSMNAAGDQDWLLVVRPAGRPDVEVRSR